MKTNQNVLDDARAFIGDYVSATDEQLDAMTLYACATHAMDAWVTFGRMLFHSEVEESGKTHAMNITLSLCADPLDTEGTQYALQAAMLSSSNVPEQPTPTLYRDEISDVTGRNGMSGGRNPIMKYLRKGYKRGATDMVSRSGVEERYSIFTAFLMTGLRPACVPRDVRSRCVCLKMLRGKPRKYFDIRESEPYAAELQKAVASAVKALIPELSKFRGRGLHPKLSARKLEVWEPLLAVAYTLGGQEWLNRAVAAFASLALDESDNVALTPRQQVIRDVAGIAEGYDNDFVPTMELADTLRRMDNPLYASCTDIALAKLIGNSVPTDAMQKRLGNARYWGYLRSDLISAWEAAQPAESPDAEIQEEHNPYATEIIDDGLDGTDSDTEQAIENGEVTSDVTDGTDGTGVYGGMVPARQRQRDAILPNGLSGDAGSEATGVRIEHGASGSPA
jgi:hypothetical protein